jgi:peptide deformylase
MRRPKDQIITLPNPHLRQKSQACNVNKSTLKLAEAMKTAVLDWESTRKHEVGVALAAIQIDKTQRVIVIRNNYEDKDDETFTTFINPEITRTEGRVEEDFEGCLSIKDVYGKVPRYTQVRVKAQDTNGKTFKLKASGFLARVLQHEIDHTNGILFLDHIRDNPEAFFHLKDDGQLEQLDYSSDVKSSTVLWS